MTYLQAAELLDRRAARRELGIPQSSLAVLIQLGSGNNFDLSNLRLRATARLETVHNIRIVNADWMIANVTPELTPSIQRLEVFPIARYLQAFDFAISTAGYNTFHENLYACLPTLFVPNENPEQDEQWLRARYAELRGLAMCAARSQPHAFYDRLAQLLDPKIRSALSAACRQLDRHDGAEDAARFVADLASTRRCWPQSNPYAS